MSETTIHWTISIGAFLMGLVNLFVTLSNFFKDRHNIDARAAINEEGRGQALPNPILGATVVNNGRRPATITRVALLHKESGGGCQVFPLVERSFTLKESESRDFKYPLTVEVLDSIGNPGRVSISFSNGKDMVVKFHVPSSAEFRAKSERKRISPS